MERLKPPYILQAINVVFVSINFISHGLAPNKPEFMRSSNLSCTSGKTCGLHRWRRKWGPAWLRRSAISCGSSNEKNELSKYLELLLVVRRQIHEAIVICTDILLLEVASSILQSNSCFCLLPSSIDENDHGLYMCSYLWHCR